MPRSPLGAWQRQLHAVLCWGARARPASASLSRRRRRREGGAAGRSLKRATNPLTELVRATPVARWSPFPVLPAFSLFYFLPSHRSVAMPGFGYRSGTRYAFKRGFRDQGRLPLLQYIRPIKCVRLLLGDGSLSLLLPGPACVASALPAHPCAPPFSPPAAPPPRSSPPPPPLLAGRATLSRWW